MKATTLFDFLGVSAEISAEGAIAEAVLADLREDFRHFRAQGRPAAAPSRVRIRLHGDGPRPASYEKLGWPVFIRKGCRAYGWRRRRLVDYDGLAWVAAETGPGSRDFAVGGRSAEAVREAAYLAMLSAVGEELDRRGYHRLHALAIETRNAEAVLVMLPSGGGKSTLAWFLAAGGRRVLSDEMPHLRGDRAYPFPIRLAVRPAVADALGITVPGRVFQRRGYADKLLLDLPVGALAPESRVAQIWIGRPPRPDWPDAALEEFFGPAGLYDRLRFGVNVVLGFGLAQMAEHMLRPGNVTGLIRIAASRLRLAVSLCRRGELRYFRPAVDARVNLERLESALRSPAGPRGESRFR